MSPQDHTFVSCPGAGIFAKYGLDPRIVLVRAAATLVATLVSGEMDVGYTGGTSVVAQRGRALSKNPFSDLDHVDSFPDRPSQYQARRRIARQALRHSKSRRHDLINTILALEFVGLDAKRDNITLLPIGDWFLVGQALEAGRVDAAVLDGALVRRLRSKGFW